MRSSLRSSPLIFEQKRDYAKFSSESICLCQGGDCNRDQKDLKPAVLKLLLAAETEVSDWLTVRSFSCLKCPP